MAPNNYDVLREAQQRSLQEQADHQKKEVAQREKTQGQEKAQELGRSESQAEKTKRLCYNEHAIRRLHEHHIADKTESLN